MTNFFTLLDQVDINSINLSIKKDASNRFTVLISCSNPTTETALNLLAPLFLTASADELDKCFFEKVTQPMEETKKVYDNVLTYQTKLEQVASSTGEEKEKQKKIKDLKDKINAIVTAPKYNAVDEKAKVLELINKIFEVDKENSFAIKCKKELLIEASKGDLFGASLESEDNGNN